MLTEPVVLRREGPAQSGRDLLKQIHRVLHAGLHAGFDDHVTDLPARGLHELGHRRPPWLLVDWESLGYRAVSESRDAHGRGAWLMEKHLRKPA